MAATQRVTKPMSTSMNGSDTSEATTIQSRAYQNVRICQRKCDSRNVPRTSPRFT